MKNAMIVMCMEEWASLYSCTFKAIFLFFPRQWKSEIYNTLLHLKAPVQLFLDKIVITGGSFSSSWELYFTCLWGPVWHRQKLRMSRNCRSVYDVFSLLQFSHVLSTAPDFNLPLRSLLDSILNLASIFFWVYLVHDEQIPNKLNVSNVYF